MMAGTVAESHNEAAFMSERRLGRHSTTRGGTDGLDSPCESRTSNSAVSIEVTTPKVKGPEKMTAELACHLTPGHGATLTASTASVAEGRILRISSRVTYRLDSVRPENLGHKQNTHGRVHINLTNLYTMNP